MKNGSILETRRLLLRRLTEDDAPFVLELVNDPDWLRYIGDKKVRNLVDACRYLQEGPLMMYQRRGHGLYAVEVKSSGLLIGICGLIKRDNLEDVDLGFAFLPAHRGFGYAAEAAQGTLEHGRRDLGLKRVVAITSPGNSASARVLERLGFYLERIITLGNEELQLHSLMFTDTSP